MISGSQYFLCNIGDSPIFIFRDNELVPIYRAHTEKENFLKTHGANAVLQKKKFKLTKNIGIFPEEMKIQDRFLITSDGFTDMIDETKIKNVLSQRMSPAKTVKNFYKNHWVTAAEKHYYYLY